MSVEDITKDSGVAKGTFYHYFECKEEVVACLLYTSIIVVIFPADHLLSTNIVQMLSCTFYPAADAYEKLMMALHQVITVLLTVAASAHNEAQLLHIQEIDVQH